ncbi:MAG: flavodoxin family protein [Clostridiales bacterium]|nr:flavodoxin family protein [Clostridiales bacterium]
MVLIINTTSDTDVTAKIGSSLKEKGRPFEIIEASTLKISHCIGCNYCWLKTPGECSIKDDYEQILKKIIKADQMWVISDTALGFIDHKGKNIYDRIIPIATMNLKFKNGQMRHYLRYDHKTDIGLICNGEADMDQLRKWNERAALNFDSKSLGVYGTDRIEEVTACMC